MVLDEPQNRPALEKPDVINDEQGGDGCRDHPDHEERRQVGLPVLPVKIEARDEHYPGDEVEHHQPDHAVNHHGRHRLGFFVVSFLGGVIGAGQVAAGGSEHEGIEKLADK